MYLDRFNRFPRLPLRPKQHAHPRCHLPPFPTSARTPATRGGRPSHRRGLTARAALSTPTPHSSSTTNTALTAWSESSHTTLAVTAVQPPHVAPHFSHFSHLIHTQVPQGMPQQQCGVPAATATHGALDDAQGVGSGQPSLSIFTHCGAITHSPLNILAHTLIKGHL